MFTYCTSLQSIELVIKNAPKLTDIGLMFMACTGLKSVVLTIENANVLDTAGSVFDNCPALESCVFSITPQRKLKTMETLFRNCSSLTSIDMSWLTDFSALMSYGLSGMFAGCQDLSNIYYNESIPDWRQEILDLGKDVSGANMFNGCTKLPNFSSASSRDLSIYRANNTENYGYFTDGLHRKKYQVYIKD